MRTAKGKRVRLRGVRTRVGVMVRVRVHIRVVGMGKTGPTAIRKAILIEATGARERAMVRQATTKTGRIRILAKQRHIVLRPGCKLLTAAKCVAKEILQRDIPRAELVKVEEKCRAIHIAMKASKIKTYTKVNQVHP